MQFMSTLRQSSNQTTKRQKDPKKSNQPTKFLTYSKPMAHDRLYYIDSIYEGTVNPSHYREGFGIMQTINFHTYIGFFKNGRAEGLGLIILSCGTRIYGNFVKDQLSGIALIDNKKLLKLGVWNKFQLNGIGYEYDYEKYLWKMVRFWKGSVTQIIKEQACNLSEKMPTLINLEHSLYFFLLNFLQANYFPHPNTSHLKSKAPQDHPKQVIDQPQQQTPSKNYIHPQSSRAIHFGQLKEGSESGIGLKYDKSDKCVSQAGFYNYGKLDGYGFKFNNAIKHKEIGMYVEGKKQGLFMHDDSGKVTFCLYHNNAFLETLDVTGRQFLRKKQKQHNYTKKSFISQKNTLDLDLVLNAAQKICMTTQGAENHKNQNQAKIQLDKILKKAQYEETKNKNKNTCAKDQVKLSDADKTSVALIKEKFKYFQESEELTFDEREIEEDQRMQVIKNSHLNQILVSEPQTGKVKWDDIKLRTASRQPIRRNLRRNEVNELDELPIAQEENPFDVEQKSTGKFNANKMMNNPFRNNR